MRVERLKVKKRNYNVIWKIYTQYMNAPLKLHKLYHFYEVL